MINKRKFFDCFLNVNYYFFSYKTQIETKLKNSEKLYNQIISEKD